ncbi:hypothetical protein WJX81_000122 [Elliptochloris bilobata]|uniref:Lariat debranching enzyme C-terminal domain-containing protein n=1 Tax=Elliptochloris bilobata TaxID=381761 RepID=A0AAW1RM72_9CHLO
MRRGLRVAVEGCCHGDLDKIYGTMQQLERTGSKKIDLLICCGDFQAVRNEDDLECLACPPKYRELKTFHRYYTGAAVAPYPTLFVGGNHEASNHLWELYYGGWAAPRIFYLGHAGVVTFGGIRIGGLSGIYNANHYRKGHFERPPYTSATMRSAYHVRELEVFRLAQLKRPLDVFLSHDWPRGIARFGNVNALCRAKSFLAAEVQDNSLGSPPAEQLLHLLRPAYWFSAHLHTKFAALVPHDGGGATRFLALDKCLPGRNFLQVIDFPEAEGPLEFGYDEEWLAVLRGTHSLLSLRPSPSSLPGLGGHRGGASEADVAAVRAALAARGGAAVPENFQATTPGPSGRPGRMPQSVQRSLQTAAFLELLGLPYNLEPGGGAAPGLVRAQPAGGALSAAAESNPEEIALDNSEEAAAANPEELDIDEVPDDDDANGISMFAPVEIHNYPAGTATAAGNGSEAPLPQALANCMAGGS